MVDEVPAEKPTSLFLSLPSELRNRVYELCDLVVPQRETHRARIVEQGTYILPLHFRSADGCRTGAMPVQPALTKVCKQIRGENLPMVYGEMRLAVYAPFQRRREKLYQWFQTIGIEKASMIRRLKILKSKPYAQEVLNGPQLYSEIASQLNKLGIKERAITGPSGESFEELVASPGATGVKK